MYKFITITPIPAPLGDILEADSPVNQGIRAETAMALAAPDLLAVLEGIAGDSIAMRGFYEEFRAQIRAAIAKAKA